MYNKINENSYMNINRFSKEISAAAQEILYRLCT